jgi:hypothetical protein
MPYADPVGPGFWSITMYDLKTSYTVDNPINKYAVSSYDKLIKNSDGSITIYIQNTSPGKDKETNWLPSVSSPFYLIFRCYAPNLALSKKLKDLDTFQGPPVIVPVK